MNENIGTHGELLTRDSHDPRATRPSRPRPPKPPGPHPRATRRSLGCLVRDHPPSRTRRHLPFARHHRPARRGLRAHDIAELAHNLPDLERQVAFAVLRTLSDHAAARK